MPPRARAPKASQQQGEMMEMSRMIDQLSQQVQNLERRGQIRSPEGDYEPLNPQERGYEEEEDYEGNVNLFHDTAENLQFDRGRLEERLKRALGLNSRVEVKISDFHGKIHVEDFLDWEDSLETYFEWKPMAKDHKVLFVNGGNGWKSSKFDRGSSEFELGRQ